MNTPARLLLALLSLVLFFAPSPVLSDAGPPPLDKPEVISSYGKLPLYFIKNDGQVDSKVAYYERGSGHATYFTREGVYLSLIPSPQSPKASESIKLSFIGANESPEIIAEGAQEGRVNYFIGSDPSKWRTDIPTYSSVLYKNVYDGIDLRFYGNNQTLEYDIIVKPGADPDVVKFSYEGIEGLSVNRHGDLEIALKQGKVVQKKPYIYQEIEGKRNEVAGSFVVSPVPNSYSFEVASYDKAKTLVIDPYLVYSTYLGGTGDDYGRAIAVDSSGNAYVTGYTRSADFPTASAFDGTLNGTADAFVTKLNPSGSALVYSTFLGGSSGDYGWGIAVDSSGNAYVTGYTESSDFPTASAFDGTHNGTADAFVTKLNPSGSALVYSTFLGGSSTDYGFDIALDSSGNAYVTGYTRSSNFPIAAAFDWTCGGCDSFSYSDAFVVKLDFSGTTLLYSTFLGGGDNDYGRGIAVDSAGLVHVTGITYSGVLPTVSAFDETYNGMGDAFVAKLDFSTPIATLAYYTYLGGLGPDMGYDIAVVSGNAYVTGQTWSSDFPTTPSAFDGTLNGTADAFVTKLSSTGSTLSYSTFLGGSCDEDGFDIALDSSGNAYVTGSTCSSDFPVTASSFDSTINSIADVFVTKLNSAGSALVYSTYLGGGGNDYGYAIAVDSSGNAYVTGETQSSDFPTANPLDGTWSGDDAFVVKMTTVNTVPSLSYSTETGYSTDGINPDTGTASTTFTYKVVYTDADNNAPNSPDVHIDGDATGVAMTLDSTASATLKDNDYTNGEQYKYQATLAAGSHNYYFTASDGTDSVRLPSSGTLSGPTLSDLLITTTSPLPAGTSGTAYSQTLTATGGTTPYTWSIASGLPPGLSLDTSTGAISGTPTTAGTYGFTATVTDTAPVGYSKAFSLTVNEGDTTPPTGSVNINSGAVYTTSTTVELSLSCVDTGGGCSQMRLSNDGLSWGEWETYATTRAWILSGGDDIKTVFAKFKDAAGNISATTSDSITFDSTPPTGSMSINGGAAYTSSSTVTLTLSCSGCTEMRFSSSPFSPWEPFAPTKSWDMGAGDGYRAVVTQFRDAAGNISVNYTAGINLDQTSPTGSIIIDGGATHTGSATVLLTLSCADAVSGCSQMRFKNEVYGVWSSWEPFATAKSWVLGNLLTDGQRTVYVQFMDAVGNVSPDVYLAYHDTINLDRTAPQGTVIIETMLTANVCDRNVTLLTTTMDLGAGCAGMRFSNDGVTWSAWQACQPIGNIPWVLSAGAGMKAVFMQTIDNMGNIGANNDGIILYDPVNITSEGVSFATAWESFAGQIFATGGDGDYIWMIVEGALPPGLSLGMTSGAVTGIPTLAGTFNFVARANYDPANLSGCGWDAQALTIEVDLVDGVDLVGAITGPNNVKIGQNFTYTGTVFNRGKNRTDKDFYVGIYLSKDVAITRADTFIAGQWVRGGLASNNGVSGALKGKVPGLKPGAYYVGIIVDDGNLVDETVFENNNTAHLAVAVETQIDLEATEVTGPAEGTRGKEIVINAEMKNNGLGDSGPFWVDIYLSMDNTITPADTRLPCSFKVDGINDNVPLLVPRTCRIPQNQPLGDYFIGVIVDDLQDFNWVPETDDTNNNKKASVQKITVKRAAVDLQAMSVGVDPVDVGAGMPVHIAAVVKNAGTADSGKFGVTFHLSDDEDSDDENDIQLLSLNFHNGLKAGAFADESGGVGGFGALAVIDDVIDVDVMLPNGRPALGDKHVVMVVDPLGEVDESNSESAPMEHNNTVASHLIHVGVSADLALTVLAADANASPNAPIDVTFTIKNVGFSVIDEDFFVDFYLATDDILGSEIAYLGYYRMSLEWKSLEVAEERSDIQTLRVPLKDWDGNPIAPGNYYVRGYADWDDFIPEMHDDDNDNVSGIVAITPGVDFTVDPPDLPWGLGPYNAGGLLAISTGVYNIGSVQSGELHVQYYLSTDNQLSVLQGIVGSKECFFHNLVAFEKDCDIGSRPIRNGIPPQDVNVDIQREMKIPQELPTGQYYVIIKADEPSKTLEANEGNNVGVSIAPIFVNGW